MLSLHCGIKKNQSTSLSKVRLKLSLLILTRLCISAFIDFMCTYSLNSDGRL